MLSEQNFRQILDTLWFGFSRTRKMVDDLETVGLDVNPDSRFGALYAIQEKTSVTILNLLGIDRELSKAEEQQTVLEKLDQFLTDLYTEYPDDEKFPDKQYEKLVKLLKESGNATFPWEEQNHLNQSWKENSREHRALCITNNIPVKGYLWEGASHAYIIPSTNGISYDEKTLKLSAIALEVRKETIAVEMHICDDDMINLFEGDTVRIGDEEIVLKLSDMNVLQKLMGPECKKYGLHLVKANYENVESK